MKRLALLVAAIVALAPGSAWAQSYIWPSAWSPYVAPVGGSLSGAACSGCTLSGTTTVSGPVHNIWSASTVASANNLVLPHDANTFLITGSTQINGITLTNWADGAQVTLVFTDGTTLGHNEVVVAPVKPLKLKNGADFVADSFDAFTFKYLALTEEWIEVGKDTQSSVTSSRTLRASEDVPSANDLTLGRAGYFNITGTTQVNAITTAGWTAGSCVDLQFASALTLKHNTAGGAGTAKMMLGGARDFVTTAGSGVRLCYDGTTWNEPGGQYISGAITIDFGSINTLECLVATAQAFTGCVSGKACAVSSGASTTVGACFLALSAECDGAGTVAVRACNVGLGASCDPSSTTFNLGCIVR